MQLAIGIDIGGQSAKLGVVDRQGNVLDRTTVTSMQDSVSGFLDTLCSAIDSLIASTRDKGQVIGIGADAPNANYLNGSIEFAPNLTWGRGADGQPAIIPFAKLLGDRTRLPVTLTNDANAAALGEHMYGVARGIDNFIMLTLGTGVGSGIVIDGKLVYGHDGFAGELGHVCAVPYGRPCNCGLNGCLETYASAIGVARTARGLLEHSSVPSLMRKLSPQTITSKDVHEAALENDRLALDTLRFTGNVLGRTMADFVKFSSPQAIVLFGGLTRAKQFFHKPMLTSFEQNLMKIWKGKIQILYSSLPSSDAAILGASSLAWQ